MKADQDDHGHRAPVVEAADELPERHRRDDASNAPVRASDGGVVELREVHAGDHHQDERDQRDSTERIRELVGVLWHRVLES
jgi:hypothetical protein